MNLTTIGYRSQIQPNCIGDEVVLHTFKRKTTIVCFFVNSIRKVEQTALHLIFTSKRSMLKFNWVNYICIEKTGDVFLWKICSFEEDRKKIPKKKKNRS